jgi:S-adenosylmethionine synthetase
MPLSTVLAHELVKIATKLIEQKKFKGAKYDMKSQVTID